MSILVKNTLAALFFPLFTNLGVVRHSAVEAVSEWEGVFSARMLVEHEKMRFHPDSTLGFRMSVLFEFR